MPRLSEQEARDLLGKVLALSRADACEANLNGNAAGNIRYARNTVTTAGRNENMTVVVQSNYGQRSGTATVNEFDDESLERAVRRSEELAKLAEVPVDSTYRAAIAQLKQDRIDRAIKQGAAPDDAGVTASQEPPLRD